MVNKSNKHSHQPHARKVKSIQIFLSSKLSYFYIIQIIFRAVMNLNIQTEYLRYMNYLKSLANNNKVKKIKLEK